MDKLLLTWISSGENTTDNGRAFIWSRTPQRSTVPNQVLHFTFLYYLVVSISTYSYNNRIRDKIKNRMQRFIEKSMIGVLVRDKITNQLNQKQILNSLMPSIERIFLKWYRIVGIADTRSEKPTSRSWLHIEAYTKRQENAPIVQSRFISFSYAARKMNWRTNNTHDYVLLYILYTLIEH